MHLALSLCSPAAARKFVEEGIKTLEGECNFGSSVHTPIKFLLSSCLFHNSTAIADVPSFWGKYIYKKKKAEVSEQAKGIIYAFTIKYLYKEITLKITLNFVSQVNSPLKSLSGRCANHFFSCYQLLSSLLKISSLCLRLLFAC